jgi:hypothetical protein
MTHRGAASSLLSRTPTESALLFVRMKSPQQHFTNQPSRFTASRLFVLPARILRMARVFVRVDHDCTASSAGSRIAEDIKYGSTLCRGLSKSLLDFVIRPFQVIFGTAE